MKLPAYKMPEIEKRLKWQMVMSILGFKAENDLHYLLFQTFKASFFVTFIMWGIVLCLLNDLWDTRIVLFYKHFPSFLLASILIIIVVIMPFYIWAVKTTFGFSKSDFLGAGDESKRILWDREKILNKLLILNTIIIVVLPAFAPISPRLLDRYEIQTWFGYITLSLILGFMVSILGMVLCATCLVFIQYKFFFNQIPNAKLHELNTKERSDDEL